MFDTSGSLKWALDLLEKNPWLYLFPIRSLEKFPPVHKDNLNIASNDPAQIRQWSAKWPGCNWGISNAKSGLIPVDVDCKPGKVGQQTFDALEDNHGTFEEPAFPPTLKVATPSGGFHLYYRATDKVTHSFTTGENGFGKDIDTPNYVLIPGCILCAIPEQPYATITDAPIADAPEWFADYLKKKERVVADSLPVTEQDTPAILAEARYYIRYNAPPCKYGENGEKTLLDIAGVLKDMGVSEYQAVQLLTEDVWDPKSKTLFCYNQDRCEPPWEVGDDAATQDRLDVKVANAYLYLKENAPGSGTAEYQFSTDPISEADLAAIVEANKSWGGSTANVDPTFQQETDDSTSPYVEETGREAIPDLDIIPPTEPFDTSERPKKAAQRVVNRPDNEKTRKWSLFELMDEWVYINNQKRFLWRGDLEFTNYLWDVEAFDNAFMYLKGKATKVSKVLLERPERTIRRFDSLGYKPGQDEFIGGKIYNMWRPSDIEPVEGDTSLWDAHIEYLWPDESDRNLVLNWFAWLIQNIDRKPMHALLLAGYSPGTGKSWVCDIVSRILGMHNVSPLGDTELESQFTEWAKKSKLLVIEELQALDRGKVKKTLHSLITQIPVQINDKNVKRYKIDNCFGIVAMTNKDAAITLEDNDRRYLVVRTTAVPREKPYYDELYSRLNDKALLGAIFYQLLVRNLGGYAGNSAAPMTKAKQDMIESGMTDLEHHLWDHRDQWPLCNPVVSVIDIQNTLPPTLGRQQRTHNAITAILKHKFQGQNLGQFRLSNGERRVLWGINGSAIGRIEGSNPAATYERCKAAGMKIDPVASEIFDDVTESEQE